MNKSIVAITGVATVCLLQNKLGSIARKRKILYKEFDAFYTDLREAWQALSKARRRELRPLPKLPPKRILGSTKTRFLTMRQEGLGRFLRLLAVHPWASEQVSFLSFTGMLSDTRTREAAEGRNVIHLSRLLDFAKVSL